MKACGVTISDACDLVGLPRSTYYRLAHGYQHYVPVTDPIPHSQRQQPAALQPLERDQVLTALSLDEYANLSVGQAFWRAFDNGMVSCSARTFYRVADAAGLVGDRRKTRSGSGTGKSSRKKPSTAATRPGQLWSWDITEFTGPNRQERYYLYLVIDVFSRFPVAWRIEHIICKAKAIEMFTGAITAYGPPEVVHSDNGATMRSHELVDALAEHGVVTSYSRPRVSEDNPFSESLFKTIKYDLACPDSFTDIKHARSWTRTFLHEYATEHRHSGLGWHTPSAVFSGTADEVHRKRQARLDANYRAHPERYRQRPLAPALPGPTVINVELSQAG